MGEANMIDKVIELVADRRTPYRTGVCAYFAKIDDDWGLKFWKNKLARERNYDNQKRAFEVGLGPALGDKFEATLPKGGTIYGFITEIVTPIYDTIEYNLITDSVQQDRYSRKLEYKLQKQLEKHDIYVTDISAWNIGYTKEGNLVCLDFGNDDQ